MYVLTLVCWTTRPSADHVALALENPHAVAECVFALVVVCFLRRKDVCRGDQACKQRSANASTARLNGAPNDVNG